MGNLFLALIFIVGLIISIWIIVVVNSFIISFILNQVIKHRKNKSKKIKWEGRNT